MTVGMAHLNVRTYMGQDELFMTGLLYVKFPVLYTGEHITQ